MPLHYIKQLERIGFIWFTGPGHSYWGKAGQEVKIGRTWGGSWSSGNGPVCCLLAFISWPAQFAQRFWSRSLWFYWSLTHHCHHWPVLTHRLPKLYVIYPRPIPTNNQALAFFFFQHGSSGESPIPWSPLSHCLMSRGRGTNVSLECCDKTYWRERDLFGSYGIRIYHWRKPRQEHKQERCSLAYV